MNLKPPSPFNNVVGIVYALLLVAAFTYAYNNVAKLRTALGGPAARPDGAKV